MSIIEMISPSLRFLPQQQQYLCTFSPSNSRGYFQSPSNTKKLVTPEPIEDNLKETPNKDYLIGWHASQHPKGDLYA